MNSSSKDDQLQGWWIFTPAVSIRSRCNPQGREGRRAHLRCSRCCVRQGPTTSRSLLPHYRTLGVRRASNEVQLLSSPCPARPHTAANPGTPSVLLARLPRGARRHRPSLPFYSRAPLSLKKKQKNYFSRPRGDAEFSENKIQQTHSPSASTVPLAALPRRLPRCRPAGSRCSALPPPQTPSRRRRHLASHPGSPSLPPPRAAVGCRFPFHLEIFSGGRSRLVISARRKRHRRGSRGRGEPREPPGSRAGRAEPVPRSPPPRTDLSAGLGAAAAAARGSAGAGGVGACRPLLPLPPPPPRRAGNMN